MSRENYTEVAEKISNKADGQVLSHIIMVLKQRIEEQLGKEGDVNSVFENQVMVLFEDDLVKNGKGAGHKAYIDVKGIDIENSGDMNTFARVFAKIDRVSSINNEQDMSYALHLKITSSGEIPCRYENGFISDSCARFAVGHDIGDIVLNLSPLIKCAIADGDQSKANDCIPKHYQADFFSYMLSDLRDFDLLGLHGRLNIDKAFEDYKSKIGAKIDEALKKEFISKDGLAEEKAKRFEEVRRVFDESEELHKCSGHCNISMAYSVFALKEVISQQFNSHIELKLKDLRNRLENGEGSENILEELSKLDKEKSRISIHLINKRNFMGEPTINCYTRKDSDTGKNLYCFEIIINQFPEKNEVEASRKKICRAIGCVYFGYLSIIEKINDGFYKGTVSETIERCKLDHEEIDGLATKLYDLRSKVFEDKIQHLKTNEKDLAHRLSLT